MFRKNKAELIEAVVKKTRAYEQGCQGRRGLSCSIRTAASSRSRSRSGDRVQLSGFGTFSAQRRPARDWRIPGQQDQARRRAQLPEVQRRQVAEGLREVARTDWEYLTLRGSRESKNSLLPRRVFLGR